MKVRVINPLGAWKRGDVIELPPMLCRRYAAAGLVTAEEEKPKARRAAKHGRGKSVQ